LGAEEKGTEKGKGKLQADGQMETDDARRKTTYSWNELIMVNTIFNSV